MYRRQNDGHAGIVVAVMAMSVVTRRCDIDRRCMIVVGMRLMAATVALIPVVVRLVIPVVVPVGLAVIATTVMVTVVPITVVPIAPAVVTVGERRSAELPW
jgi:hypothetical protein